MTVSRLSEQEKAWRQAQVDYGRRNLSNASPAIQAQAEILFGWYVAGELTQAEIDQAILSLLGEGTPS